MTEVVLSRDKGWVDRIRQYQVFIDGNRVGKIGPGETCAYPCSPGLHNIQVKIDWAKTKLITFNLTTENKKFQVKSNLHGWRIFLCAIFAFMPSKWIVLEDEPGDDSR